MRGRIFTMVVILGFSIFISASMSLSSDITQSLLYPEYSKRISLDFKNANLKDVLKVFSQQSGLNFIASQDVQDKSVTLYLDNVPVEYALEQILSANKLSYELEPGTDIFIVKPSGEPEVKTLTKVYYLKYASVSGSRMESQSASGLSASSSSSTSSSYATSGQSYGVSGSGSTGTSSPISQGITSVLKSLLSEYGKLSEDSRTNSLTITDIPNKFPLIEQAIASLDVAVPQILIEVEMLDVTKDATDALGVKFGQTPFRLYGAKKSTYFPFQEFGQNYPSAPVYTTGSSTVGTLDFSGLTAALEFLSTRSDTKYLARPRILTLSNQTAEIKISTQEAVGQQSSVGGAASGTTTTTEQAERYETGVVMRVTPQVNLETGEITMYIEPKVSETKEGGTYGGITYKDPETRETKTMVRIREGETVVIGGLMRTRRLETITKLPILGDIPILGAAFRHKNKSKDEERELVVFITPRLVKESSFSKSLAKITELPREQDIPLAHRETAIDKALSYTEKERIR